jgi:hypothetical protein
MAAAAEAAVGQSSRLTIAAAESDARAAAIGRDQEHALEMLSQRAAPHPLGKCWKPGNTVGSGTVQFFVGALVGRGASKGVLITTPTFTKAAEEAAEQSGSQRVVLIDGETLTNLMVRFNAGVRTAQTVEVKRIDINGERVPVAQFNGGWRMFGTMLRREPANDDPPTAQAAERVALVPARPRRLVATVVHQIVPRREGIPAALKTCNQIANWPAQHGGLRLALPRSSPR